MSMNRLLAISLVAGLTFAAPNMAWAPPKPLAPGGTPAAPPGGVPAEPSPSKPSEPLLPPSGNGPGMRLHFPWGVVPVNSYQAHVETAGSTVSGSAARSHEFHEVTVSCMTGKWSPHIQQLAATGTHESRVILTVNPSLTITMHDVMVSRVTVGGRGGGGVAPEETITLTFSSVTVGGRGAGETGGVYK